MKKVPAACFGVKCMQPGCENPASHKIGEINIFDPCGEKELHDKFNGRHELTTYLCEEHFGLLMKREERYSSIDERFNHES